MIPSSVVPARAGSDRYPAEIVETLPRPRVVCFPFVGDVIGGSHISALGLIQKLDQRRFEPLVLLQDMNGPVAELFRDANVRAEAAPVRCQLEWGQGLGAGDIARLVADFPRMIRFLRERQVDIVHSNDGRTHVMWAVPARLAGAKLVWHHRGSPDAAGLKWLAPLLANRLVTVSRFAAPRSGPLARPGRYQVVHSPFAIDGVEDRRQRRAELIDELGCAPDTRLIGFFGTTITRKRPLLFVEAIAMLRRRAPQLPVLGLLFGDPLQNTPEMIMGHARAHDVGDAIRLMGFRRPGSRWLAACDLLMVPAVDEPFGRTLIEAMLLGTPVVATASGGNPEALRDGETGLLTPPEDPDALAQAALRLLTDPELYETIAANARIDARGRFGEQQHADAIAQVYEDVLRSA